MATNSVGSYVSAPTPMETVEIQDTFITLKDTSVRIDGEKQNNRVYSSALKSIKELFHSIETSISSSIERFQIARQKDRIQQLELKTGFYFNVDIGGTEKDSLDIQEALLNANLSNSFVNIDKSGKLCDFQNGVLGVGFSPGENSFKVCPGPQTPHHDCQVNGQSIIELGNWSTSYQNHKLLSLTDEKGQEFFFIAILTHPEITNVEYSNKSPMSESTTQHKEQNNQICLAFSSALKSLKELFHSTETRIISSIERFQIESQQERIRQLELKSDFDFKLTTLHGTTKDLLDIREALLNASLGRHSAIYIDRSGKLCESQNDALIITFFPGIGFRAYSYFGAYDSFEVFEVTDKEGHEILKIDITPNQHKIRARREEALALVAAREKNEAALKTALLEARTTSQVPKPFYIDSYGKQCNEIEAEARIHYSPFTENFWVDPMHEETSLQLNGQKIKDAGSRGTNFQHGKNYFTSDTNPIGFTVDIPLITKEPELTEAQIKVQSYLFLKVLTEMEREGTPHHIYIDKNGKVCDEEKDDSIIIVHEERATFIAYPSFSENNNWKVNGKPIGMDGVRFNIYQSNSFTRGESRKILSIKNIHPSRNPNEPPILLPYS
jgi:hypothetical protein